MDLCLEVDKDPVLEIRVAGVFSIQVMVADKVQVGNTTLAFVRLLDGQQNRFSASQFRLVLQLKSYYLRLCKCQKHKG